MITEKEIRDVIAESREGYDVKELSSDTDFGEAGLDSLDHANILLGLQEKTGIEFPEDASKLNTVNVILAYLTAHGA